MLVRMSREFTLSSDVPFRLVSFSKVPLSSAAQHFMSAFAQPRHLMMRLFEIMHTSHNLTILFFLFFSSCPTE